MEIQTLLFLVILILDSSGHPYEGKGVVTSIISGSSFEVSGIGCVRLADIMSSSENTLSGLKAREFTRDLANGHSNLLGPR